MLATLQDAGNTPVDVAVWSRRARSRRECLRPERIGQVSVYRIGATTPTSTLTDPSAATGLGVAFDDGGNCYLLYDTNSVGSIDEFAGCAGTPVSTGLTNTINGMTFDGAGNLYYTLTNWHKRQRRLAMQRSVEVPQLHRGVYHGPHGDSL